MEKTETSRSIKGKKEKGVTEKEIRKEKRKKRREEQE